MSEHGLGRNPSPFDDRNWKVPRLLALIDEGVAVPVSWATPIQLNQGATNRCVGYTGGLYKATAQANAPADATVTNADGDRIYAACKVRDGQPGQQNGTSMYQLAHVLKDMGVIDAYAFGTYAESNAWVNERGPVPIGTNWYAGFDVPSTAGIIHRTGTIRGGHATLWRASDSIAVGHETIRSPWGPWGFKKSGDAAIPNADMAHLLDDENGDAICAVKFVEPVPPKPVAWPDIPPEYAADALLVKDSGLFLGYPDNTFRPNELMRVDQLVTVFGRAYAQRPTTRLDCLRMLAWWLRAQ